MRMGLLLSLGTAVVYFTGVEWRHHGNLAGAQTLADGATLMGIYFGAFAAVLIGTRAGTADVTSGIFRDLLATGRSRITLFLVRVPAAIVVALALCVGGFAVSVAAAYAGHGSAPAPAPALIVQCAAWVALATSVQATLAVGLGSLVGSRSIALVAILGGNVIATPLIYIAGFLGPVRDLVPLIALGRLFPGPAVGTHAHPGSSIALDNFKLPMPAPVAILVLLAWAGLALVGGAWRTRTCDA